MSFWEFLFGKRERVVDYVCETCGAEAAAGEWFHGEEVGTGTYHLVQAPPETFTIKGKEYQVRDEVVTCGAWLHFGNTPVYHTPRMHGSI